MTMTLVQMADELLAIIEGERPRLNKTEMREYVRDLFAANAARLTQPAQLVDVDFTISDAEPRILTWHGSRGCRPATSAEVSLWDKLAAALQEKGNG